MPKSKVHKKGNSKKSKSIFLRVYAILFLTATVGLALLFKFSPLFNQIQQNSQVLQSSIGPLYPEHFYVIDNSGSITSDRLKIEKAASNYLIDRIIPPRGGVYKFTNVASLLANLTLNKTTLHNAANSLKVAEGGARDFKLAINVAVDKLLSQNAVCPAIVILSDGKFSTEQVRTDALAAAGNARSRGIAIYGIAAKPRSQQDSDFVKDLAKGNCAGSPHCGEFQVLTGATIGTKLNAVMSSMSTRCTRKFIFSKTVKLYRDAQPPEPPLDQAWPGDRAHYTVPLTNTDITDLLNVVIRDTIPSYSTYIPGSARLYYNDGTMTQLTPVNNVITANVGNVAPGKWVRLEFATIFNPDIPNGYVITNRATVSGSNFSSTDTLSPPVTIQR